jgi:hypothetical protein
MPIERALAFRAGSGTGATCGAAEVAWEEGPTSLDIRVIRQCTNPPEVSWHGTGLCRACQHTLEHGTDRRLFRPQPRRRR